MGRPARRAMRDLLPELISREKADLVIANAENAAGGMGVDLKSAKELLSAGVHVLTSGNHIWKKKEIYPFLDEHETLIRPANFPAGAPGRGWCFWRHNELQAVIINLQGRVFMPNHVEDPFRCVDELLQNHGRLSPVIIVDMHGEATSEKIAMGRYLDGRASVVGGTHTHVQTADEQIMPEGTAYITDLGMVGPHDGVIGMRSEIVLERFLRGVSAKFEPCEGEIKLNGLIVDVDEETGRASRVERLSLQHS